MPEKTTPSGRKYDVTGKALTWHPEDEDGETGNLPDVVIPMRIKLKVIRSMNDQNIDSASMFAIIESLVPGQGDALDEMDVNDFQDMFATWQSEYKALSGASLGESVSSPA